ncbi:hypothetical protein ASPWEDRAFT_105358 [Aspergillus wentii DTO 134E9]|uniref:Signal peptide peptidase n=1 Tax=Aspergillus wentii DTO 134E9 TaxID=1073089 RepID=A0A1L9RTH2_ASPWE|nr:uncharacterized protein ASPWEDRAFT_105358 [Aspergillus wentii DTO 134E9]KAI9933814.1 hypothetical protein MW887_004886 [Aspergillus wentii]OJJ38158.1 hypothetical protein ASPWEDRAFT_105358 [Aspergillus wentii DTO 134E9]
MDEVSPLAELLGQAIYQFTLIKPLLPTYGHLLVSAIFPIYIGAHASLSRPSSAAKPPKKDGDEPDNEDEDEDEEEQGTTQKMEGLSPSDALMFPLTAGLTLGGLYLVIKWLGDPAILNKILSFYFSQMGLFFAVAFLKDMFLVFRSFVFPNQYRQGGKIWKAKQSERIFTNNSSDNVETRRSPLPGIFGAIPLPNSVLKVLWTTRNLAYQRVKLRIHVRGLMDVKCRLGLLDVFSVIVALSVVGYFAFVTKPWWLTNFMGFCFCYGALQFMSPSTFWTGTLILSSLFFYDIYFVFFTPLMVTVATKLDVPIKLLFPRPPAPSESSDAVSLAMLGLGDIVIPGMMAGLALRFDLFLFYKKKGARKAQAEGKEHGLVKPQYQSATGGWGERFWTGSVKPSGSELEPPYHNARSFPKTYFKASIVGYLIGMITTLVAMQYSNHAQPALLYLVPGVLLSLWGTALIKKEIPEMWQFSDEEEEDDEDEEKKRKEREDKKEENEKEKKKQEGGKKSLFSRLWTGDLKGLADSSEATDDKKDDKEDDKTKDNAENDETKEQDSKEDSRADKSKEDDDKDIDLVSISISLPRKTKSRKQRSSSDSSNSVQSMKSEEQPIPNTLEPDNEPPAKRRRRSPRVAKAAAESDA